MIARPDSDIPLSDLIELARQHEWTEYERRLHAVSFTYGNLTLDGCDVTREDVERAYDALFLGGGS